MQPGYGRFQQGQPTRSPATARRPGPIAVGAPQPQPHAPTAGQPYPPQRNAALEHQLAQRRARKPHDRNMPDGVEECVIGDGIQEYKALREVERKLDYTMMRKRLDIHDSVTRNGRRFRTMRIWITNTAQNQPWQATALEENAFDFSQAEDGTYRVKIEGRLLDDDETLFTDEEGGEKSATTEAQEQEGEAKPTSSSRKRFSQFFRSITVEFDKFRGQATDPMNQIEWRKPQQNAPNAAGASEFDMLEFERKGDENMNITINLTRDETPERYSLSPALAEVLDTKEEDRAGIVLGIWDYVRAMGLQEDEEKRAIRCDDRLKAVFGADTIFFPQIPERISSHCTPLTPIKLPYTIRVDPQFLENPVPTVYDIRVAVEDPLRAKMVALTSNPAYSQTLRQIAQYDDSLALIIQAIAHSKAKHNFYTAMSKDPSNFVKRWISSQKRDLEMILGEATRGGGEDASGPEFQRGGDAGVWDSPAVRDTVRYMLARPEATAAR